MNTTRILKCAGIDVVELCDPDRLPAQPLVSVATAAYNHAPWIAEVIEGILAQRVNFPFELVIAEDCSKDDTRELVKSYQARYPGIIRLLLPEKNLGAVKNCQHLLDCCRGKYVAMCEGDDVWLSPDKLQRQVDILESRPEVSLCFHRVQRGPHPGHAENDVFPGGPRPAVFPLADVVADNCIPTCSMVMRRKIAQSNPAWAQSLPFGDWPLLITAGLTGQLAFIDAVMAFYRVHASGSWTGKSRVRQFEWKLAFYAAVRDQIPAALWRSVARPAIADARIRLAFALRDSGDLAGARREWWRAIRTSPGTMLRRPGRLLKCFLQAHKLDFAVSASRQLKLALRLR